MTVAAAVCSGNSAIADPPSISYPYVNEQSSTTRPLNPSLTPNTPWYESNTVDPDSAGQDSSAVQDITGHQDNWWDDIIGKQSPFHFGLGVSETYDDNIFIQRNKTSDYVTRISPSIGFQLGDQTSANGNYLSVFFKPTVILYAENSDQDAEDYYADVAYQHQFTRLTVGIEQKYEKLSNSSIDVGNLVKRDIYTTIAKATYDYNEKLSFVITGTQNIASYESKADSDTNEWIADGYALYQILPKVSLGLGPRIGFLDVVGAPNQTYQDGLVHLIYQATGKITLTLVAGGEVREYQDSTPNTVSPVYEFSVDYQATDSTLFTFDSFSHRVVSYSEVGQDYQDTVITARVRQRFLQDYYFIFSGGYDNAQYHFAQAGLGGTEREDNYFFVNVGGEWKPNNWLSLSANYQYSKDNSNQTAFSFNDNQVTLQASVTY